MTRRRRSVTPSTRAASVAGVGPEIVPADGPRATRRGGARHGVSIRVVLRSGSGRVYRGWALNVSRGGIRVILEVDALEAKLEPGSDFDVTLTTGADPASSCKGRLVWVQEEPDGIVCGLQIRR